MGTKGTWHLNSKRLEFVLNQIGAYKSPYPTVTHPSERYTGICPPAYGAALNQ